MGAHVVLLGPHGVGKTTLAKTLATHKPQEYKYQINQLVTTRQRRAGEDDTEYDFVTPEEFERQKRGYFMLFPNRGVSWNYAMRRQPPLAANEIRLHVLIPEVAREFRKKITESILICAILSPSDKELQQHLRDRDLNINKDELALRIHLMEKDVIGAKELADVVFYNEEGLEKSAEELGKLIEQELQKRSL